MKVNLRIIINILIIISFSGCEEQIPYLKQNTCDLPCWNGANIGETNKSDFISILDDLPIVDHANMKIDGGQWHFFEETVFFNNSTNDVQAVAFFISDMLVDIDFEGEVDTTFGEMIELIGEPDFIINVPLSGGMPGVPSRSYAITAIYPDLGASFTYDTRNLQKKYQSEITPEIPINSFSLFDPGIYDQLLEAGLFGQGFMNKEETLRNMKPWVGYGSISTTYPPSKWNSLE